MAETSSDAYLGGILVGDDFSGGEEPPDWLAFVRAGVDVEAQLRLSMLLATRVPAGASVHAFLSPDDRAVVHGAAAVAARLTEQLSPQVVMAARAQLTAGMPRLRLGFSASASGHASVSATLNTTPRLPTATIRPKASVVVDLRAGGGLPGVAILAQALLAADIIINLADLESALIQAAAEVHVGLSSVRHRTLVMFVTAGRSVDNTLEMELESTLGSDTRQIVQPAPRRTQTASYG